MKTLIPFLLVQLLISKAFSQQLAGGIFYSQNFNYYEVQRYYKDEFENIGNNYSTGVKFTAFFNQHTAVESGMHLTYFAYRISYDTTGFVMSSRYPLSTDVDAIYAEVPIGLSFNVSVSNKVIVFGGLGVTQTLHIHSSETTTYSDSVSQPENILTLSIPYAQVSIGVKYLLKDQFFIRFEPQYRRSGMWPDDYSLSFALGLEYQW